MWELDYNESWALKNWCSWTVVLEKTLESPLDCKEIKLVNPKGNQPWVLLGRTDAEALILWPPDTKNWIIGKDSNAGKNQGQEEKGATEDGMVGWYHHPWYHNRHEFEQTLGGSEGQGSQAAKSRTRLSHWTATTQACTSGHQTRFSWTRNSHHHPGHQNPELPGHGRCFVLVFAKPTNWPCFF